MHKHTPGTWYIAPASDPADEWSAGYQENSFPLKEDAEQAISWLSKHRGTDDDYWTVRQRPVEYRRRRTN